MNRKSLMEKALGEQWNELPPALKAHHRHEDNTDTGGLTIEYPAWMTPYLHLAHAFGALINRRGTALPTTVEKRLHGDTQHWSRTTHFPDGREARFNSRWLHAGGNELIEYVNHFIGLRMSVHVMDGRLHFKGKHILINLGGLRLPIPESLILGHTTIIETALDDEHFEMDFRLTHPLFGQIYRYSGIFRVSRTLPPED
ncbi:MAG: DUF4166 domain-containing protein [Pseudomonadota bacterium]